MRSICWGGIVPELTYHAPNNRCQRKSRITWFSIGTFVHANNFCFRCVTPSSPGPRITEWEIPVIIIPPYKRQRCKV